ncbi:uncharacterized protein LOC144572515 [Carex rostrata]
MFKLNLRNVREKCLQVNMEKAEQLSSLVDEWRGKAKELEIRLEEVHESEKCKTKSLASTIQQLQEKETLLHEREIEIYTLKEKMKIQAAKEEEQLLEKLHQVELQVNVANKAIEEARTESLQLKERLLDKENEFQSITQKNEVLRARQSKAKERIDELSSQLKKVVIVEKA